MPKRQISSSTKSTEKEKMAEKNENATEDPQEDIVPEPDDDVEVATESEETEVELEARPVKAEPEIEKSPHDAARDDIAELYRQQRDAEILADKESEEELEVEPEPEPEEIVEKEEKVDDDPMVSLKVDGIEKKVPQSEANSLAQMYLASDNRLSEANRLLDEMKALKDEPPADKPGDEVSTDADEPAEAGAETKALDPEKLSEIAEQLQVGDQEDAVKAVSNLLALAQEQQGEPDKGTPPLDEAQRKAEYREFIVQENIEREFQESLDKFGKDFPSIADDQELHQVSISAAARVMREEMAEKNLLSEAELSQLAQDPRETAAVFRQFKNAGQSLRNYAEVFTDVGEHVTSKFLPESPSPTTSASEKVTDKSQERTELKRSAQQQPRQAAVKSQPDKGPKPKTKAEVVEEMRAARNYPPSM